MGHGRAAAAAAGAGPSRRREDASGSRCPAGGAEAPRPPHARRVGHQAPDMTDMPLTHAFTVGTLRCHTLEAGLQRLDGGAMFGVVPKPLWEKRIAPDARNRIPLAMRPLLVEHPDGLVLIDNGLGNKED